MKRSDPQARAARRPLLRLALLGLVAGAAVGAGRQDLVEAASRGVAWPLPPRALRTLPDLDLSLVRVVGIGEPTHSTAECFSAQAGLTRQLVEEEGFSVIALETPAGWAETMSSADEGVRARRELFGLWYHREYDELFAWQLARLRAAGGPLVVGFDPQSPESTLASMLPWLREACPAFVAPAEAARGALDRGPYRLGFAFSAEELRGQEVRVELLGRGQLGTNLTLGCSDRTEPGSRSAPAMQELDERWRPLSATLRVDPGASEVRCGVTAGLWAGWVELAGLRIGRAAEEEPGGYAIPLFPAQEGFDEPWGRETRGEGPASIRVEGRSDPEVGAILRLERAAFDPASAALLRPVRDALAGCSLSEPDRSRADYLLRALEQGAALRATSDPDEASAARDRMMADNVAYLSRERFPGARIVVLGHNMHVGAIPGAMGAYLREELGEGYLAIGQAAGELGWRSSTLGPVTWDMRARGPLERRLARLPGSHLLVDARRLSSLAGTRLGDVAAWGRVRAPLSAFDVLLFHQATTPAAPLR